MNTRLLTAGMLFAIALTTANCGGDDPDPEVETATLEYPEYVPTRLEDSLFFEIPELLKTTPEIADGIFARAEAILTDANLLEAAKASATPATLELLQQWEKEPLHLVASHFGQRRFIVAFAGASTGDIDKDYAITRELQTNLGAHARKVVMDIVAETELRPKPVRPPKPPAAPKPIKPEVLKPEVIEPAPIKPEVLPPDPVETPAP